jgi:hypothetical protein
MMVVAVAQKVSAIGLLGSKQKPVRGRMYLLHERMTV